MARQKFKVQQYIDLGDLGGVNLLQDPAAVDDSQSIYTKNVFPTKPGIISTRDAMKWEYNLYSAQDTIPPQILGSFSEMEGIHPGYTEPFVPIDFVNEPITGGIALVYVDPYDGIGYLDVFPKTLADSPPVNLGELVSRPTMFVQGGHVYVFTGNDQGWRIDSKVSDPGRPEYEPVTWNGGNRLYPRLACERNGRVWYANFSNWPGSTGEQRILISERYLPTELTTAFSITGSTDVTALNGPSLSIPGSDPITAISEVSTSHAGGPNQSCVLVFTAKNTYMFTGESSTEGEMAAGTDTIQGSLQMVHLNGVSGCCSQATIVRTPYGMLWASEDDVWFMATGSLPVRIGTLIRPVLVDQPYEQRWKMHAVYDNGIYKLAMFAPGQGPSTYSPCEDQWWLDLRNGPDKAVWFGPQSYVPLSCDDGVGTYCMRPDANGRILGVMRWRSGVAAGPDGFQGLSVVGFDAPDAYDTAAPQSAVIEWKPNSVYGIGDVITPQYFLRNTPWFAGYICTASSGADPTQGFSGATEPDWPTGSVMVDNELTWTPINWTLTNGHQSAFELPRNGNEVLPLVRSKEHLLDDGGLEKLVGDIELGYWSDRPVKMVVTRLTDWSQVVSTLLQPTTWAELDSLTSPLDSTRLIRQWQSRLLPADPLDRIHGLSIQVNWTVEPGWLVTAGFNDFIRFVKDGDSVQTATIAPGWYATWDLLRVAWAAALAPFSLTLAQNFAVPYLLNSSGSTYQFFPTDPDSNLARVMNSWGWRLATTIITLAPGERTWATDPIHQTPAPRIQINSMKLRYKGFGRRPT